MTKKAFHAGVWKKSELDKDLIDIKDALYVAPNEKGAYLGHKKPSRSGDEINTLFEIRYSNPNFFRDMRYDSTDLGQEGLWVGKNLKLKKIKDTKVKIPKRFRGKPLRYRHIVAEVDESQSDRTPTVKEYSEVVRSFVDKYNKNCQPDDFNDSEKKFFYNSLQKIVEKNPSGEIEETSKSLDKYFGLSSLAFLIVGASFSSMNITGNTILGISKNTNSIVGTISLIMASGFYSFSRKKKYKLPLPRK